METFEFEKYMRAKENDQSKKEISELKQEVQDLESRLQMEMVGRIRKLERENHILQYKYVPRKHDDIDQALAHFTNNYPEGDKIKIMFLRESEGVYRFGQRRVFIKVEQGNVQVRVGGGYVGVQEFIQEYTASEV